MPNTHLFKLKVCCLALLLWLCVVTPQALAGRYVLNQTSETIQRYFGQPVNDVRYYSTKDLERMFPDIPKPSTLKITFANNKAQRIELEPTESGTQAPSRFDPVQFFEYIFGYKPPIYKVIAERGGEGFKSYDICLGDGVVSTFTIAPVSRYISLSYKKACEPPYK
jgi:hypothetical protein